MPNRLPGLSTSALLALLLCGCGGGSSSPPPASPPVNILPTANAGSNQTVISGAAVTLDGSASSDSDGTIASYAWTQTSGTPTVTRSEEHTSELQSPCNLV